MLWLEDRWIWDFWLVEDGATHHLFFLHAPRALADPELRHWNVRIGHAVSSDLRRWEVLDDALAPAPGPAWDDLTTWTGSTVRHAGRWWMFYTGTSRAEDGKVQRIGAAVSDDLHRWRRVGDRPLIEADRRWYEKLDLDAWYEEAWRDPWVLADDAGVFHAFVTARAASGDPGTRGVIGHAVSDDLLSWRVGPPVTEPGVFGHLEIPQVVRIGGAHRLLFATPPAPARVVGHRPAAGVGGTHVLSGQGLAGPYQWTTHRLLDGDAARSRYGGRLVRTPDGWALLAWLDRAGDGSFVGAIADPVPVGVDRSGDLRLFGH